jgi:hypothetical protein
VVSISTALPSGGRVCTAPRLRQSLAALVSGYGLNEKPGYGLNEKRGYGLNEKPGYGLNEKRGYGLNEKPGYGLNEKRGYGLNEKRGYGLNEKLKARRRLILLPCSLASIRPSKFAQPANFLKSDPADVR